MARVSSLAFVLAAAAAACSGKKSDVEAPPDQVKKATETSDLTPNEQDERFQFDSYPSETVVQSGGFGESPGGVLVAASSEKQINLNDLTATGPVVLIFYRGHW